MRSSSTLEGCWIACRIIVDWLPRTRRMIRSIRYSTPGPMNQHQKFGGSKIPPAPWKQSIAKNKMKRWCVNQNNSNIGLRTPDTAVVYMKSMTTVTKWPDQPGKDVNAYIIELLIILSFINGGGERTRVSVVGFDPASPGTSLIFFKAWRSPEEML